MGKLRLSLVRWAAVIVGMTAVLLVTMNWNVLRAEACSPMAWTFDLRSEDASAILYGEATDVSKDGRKATIEVIDYVGDGEAPKTTYLPPTESGETSSDFMCGDFSSKFEKGQLYIVFLKGVGDQLALLAPKDLTVFQVDKEEHVFVDALGKQMEVSTALERYAAAHQRSIQQPDSNSPIWGKPKSSLLQVTSISIVMLTAAIIVYLLIFRRKRPHHS